MRLIAVVAAAAGASLALAAPAMAAKSQKAKFKVEVFAEQHVDWTQDSSIQDFCSGATIRHFGSGAQSFALTTKKPVKVTAMRNKIDGQYFSAIFAGKPTNPDLGLPVNVAADREGNIETQTTGGNGEACGDGDGGGASEPPPSDCGPRNFLADVRLGYYEPENYPGDPAPLVQVLTLNGPFGPDNDSPLGDAWTNCPGPANGGASLLETPTGGLPANKLFGKKKKFKVKAKDSETLSNSSTQQTTQMNWTVEFKRIRG